MSQVNLNKQQDENAGRDAGANTQTGSGADQGSPTNSQNQPGTYQGPYPNTQSQPGMYQGPYPNTQGQPGTYQDPLANMQGQPGTYQDPLQNAGKEPEKKKMGGSDWVATILAIVLVRLVGVVGALICFGGYWAVRAIVKSKMGVGAKVVLGVLVGLAFVILMVVFILFSAYLSASIN